LGHLWGQLLVPRLALLHRLLLLLLRSASLAIWLLCVPLLLLMRWRHLPALLEL
jgi:hypothetical protein